MAPWRHYVKIKHLFTESEDHATIQASMIAVAKVLESDSWFQRFNSTRFHNIPQGDDVLGPVDYANRLIDWLYDYADENLIWIE